MRSLGRGGSFLIASLAWANPAWTAEPIRFDYQASAGCPDEAAFLERVRARTERGKFAAPGELARTFTVSVTSNEQASSARVEFVDSNGERVVRAVSGETCDEVVSGIALITALAIDARATAEEAASAAPADEKPAEAAPEAPSKVNEVQRRQVAEVKRGLRWEVGVQGSANTWAAPDVAYGLGVFGEVDFDAAFLRYVRLGLLRATSNAFVGAGDTARSATFTSTAARLSACPASLVLVDHLALVPCVGVDLGALSGEGNRSAALPRERSDTIFLPVGVAQGELRYDLDDFLVFELRADVGFPLRRREFAFSNPAQTVFNVPGVGFGGGVSVGLRFP